MKKARDVAKRTYDRGLRVPHLEYWRNRRALTQNELAQRAGVARSTVVRGEAGGKISAGAVRHLAGFLGIAPEELTGIDEAPTQTLPAVPSDPMEDMWEAKFQQAMDFPEPYRTAMLEMYSMKQYGRRDADLARRIHAEHIVDAEPADTSPPSPAASPRQPADASKAQQ